MISAPPCQSASTAHINDRAWRHRLVLAPRNDIYEFIIHGLTRASLVSSDPHILLGGIPPPVISQITGPISKIQYKNKHANTHEVPTWPDTTRLALRRIWPSVWPLPPSAGVSIQELIANAGVARIRSPTYERLCSSALSRLS